MGGRLEITSLGRVAVQLDGRPVTGLASRKAEALLVYLAYTGQPAPREVLATLLWDDLPADRVLGNLSVLLTSLRKELASFLAADRDSVALAPDSDWSLDARTLRLLLEPERADRDVPRGWPAERLKTLEDVLALYKGEFLQGLSLRGASGLDEWATVERERLSRLALSGLRLASEAYQRQRDYRRAMDHAARWLALDPLSEAAHRMVMLLQARQGEIPQALARYKACRDVLQAELGVEPSFETTALYHRLRSAAETRARSLPVPPTPFVGRTQELQRIEAMLADPECRLITLVGPGGVGKTRLAMEAASRASSGFLHGLCFVPLGALQAPDQVLAALSEAFEFTFQPGPDMGRQLLGYLREREQLLLLDGCEHLLGGVGFVGEVLAAAPTVKILATSRSRLPLLGEWHLEVEGLPYPEKEVDLAGSGYAAIDLFVQSASRAREGFAREQEAPRSVQRICRKVEGLPLALELAAAWLTTYSLREVAEHVERSPDFLAGSYLDLPERQRSLRAIFEHTWAMLSPGEQECFRSLSVFPGSFSRTSAEAIAAARAPNLTSLVDKSLLHRLGPDRYEVHEVLRVYAMEKAEEQPEIAAAVRAGFRSHFSEFVGRVAADLAGLRQAEAVRELSLELENLRFAWTSAVQERDLAALETSADGIFQFYMIRGLYQEGADAFEAAIRALEAVPPTQSTSLLRPRLLARAGAFDVELSRMEQAGERLQTSVDLLHGSGRNEDLILSLQWSGILARMAGRYADSRLHHEESLALAQSAGSQRAMANAYNGLGNAAYMFGDYEAANESFRSALVLFEDLDDRLGADRCLLNLANVADRQGNYPEARQLYERSLSLSRDIGDRWGEAAALNNLGNVALALDENPEARRLYEESLAIKRELGHPQGIAASLDNLGRVALRLKELPEALHLRQASLSIRREIKDLWGVAYSLNGLGDVAVEQGDYAEAARAYREALQTAIGIQVPMLVEAILVGWADLLWKQGEVERPLEMVSVVLKRTARDRLTQARAVQALADMRAQADLERVSRAEARAATLEPEDLARDLLAAGAD